MCLMRGWPPLSSDRAARGGPRTPIAAPVAPRATIDSHSRRPVVFAMLNGSGWLEARGSRRDALVHTWPHFADVPPATAPRPDHSNLEISQRLRDLGAPHHTAGPPSSR